MYFEYRNGQYEEDPNGPICGITGVDENGHDYRCIMFMPQITTLQYGQYIEYVYLVQVKPIGIDHWIDSRNETMRVDNTQYIRAIDGIIVPPEEALDEEGNLKAGYLGELDYYIDSVCKGLYARVIVYDLVMNAMLYNEAYNVKSGVQYEI